MAGSTPNLLSLPAELLVEIADYLPADGIVALQLSQRYLDSLFKNSPKLRKNRLLTDCARLAIRTYLKLPSANIPPRLRCAVCKQNYPIALFNSSESPACLSVPQPTAAEDLRKDVLELPDRVCAWHVSRLVRVKQTGPGGRNEWTSTMKQLCLHCGEVKGWGSCNCKCETCGIRKVRTYVRCLNNKNECKTFGFWRQYEASADNIEDSLPGSLFVRETLYQDDATTETSIDLPVQFRDHDPDIDTISLPSRKLASKL